MAHLIAQVVLPDVSQVPRDACVNTFHFNTASANEAAAIEAANLLVDFYNTPAPGVGASDMVGSWLSADISRAANATKIKVYDGAGLPPNRPIYEDEFTLVGPKNTGRLPREVALVGSFFAGSNKPRFRGRIYLGPLCEAIADPATGRPVSGARNALAQGLKRLADGNLVCKLAVFSTVDQVARVVTGGWVDDEYDTQRRRGRKSTARTTFAATP